MSTRGGLETVMDRQSSYRKYVLIGGLIHGLVSAIPCTILVALIEGPGTLRWLPFGVAISAWMGLTFTAMSAILLWQVRREFPVTDCEAARQRLTRAAAELQFPLVEQSDDYFRFHPRS